MNPVSKLTLPLNQLCGSGSGTVSGIGNLNQGETSKTMVKITCEEIEDEITFWSSAMVCYVLGANPPLAVMDGFCRRMWKGNVDKVGSPRHGVFIVRFQSVEFRDQIVNGGYLFFNNRPAIMKNWMPDVDITKNDVSIVPIWIHLENLELKYWGERSLFKIVRQIGEPIRVDVYTKERNRL